MRRRQRPVDIFSLSMMDVVTSGMGAVVVLLFLQSMKVAQAQANKEALQKATIQIVRMVGEIDKARAKADKAMAAAAASDSAAAASDSAAAAAQSAAAKAEMELKISEARGRFLGVETKKKNLLFLVDLSGSMKAHQKLLGQALSVWVDSLSDTYKFNVVGYHGAPGDILLPMEKGGLVPVTKASRQRARDFIEKDMLTVLDFGTPTEEAFYRILDTPGLEAVIIFTDGEPDNCASLDCLTEMAGRITAFNKSHRDAEIHTIQIGIGVQHSANPNLMAFLIKLKDANRGQYSGLGI